MLYFVAAATSNSLLDSNYHVLAAKFGIANFDSISNGIIRIE